MNIRKLRLKGFIGIQKGMGLEEVTVDFSDAAGLIAFEGQNGNGKTTILENLHPYPMLVSRNNALSHHVFLRDSEKELTFEYMGSEYRTLVKIDSHTRKTEGFIWKDGESLVDGKISNYKSTITDLFGTPNLFFSSVFCAQGSTKLSDLRPADLKKLFVEFLRLDRYVGWEKTAKACIDSIGTKKAVIEADIIRTIRELDTKDDLVKELAEIGSKKHDIEREIGYIRDQLLHIQQNVESARAAVSDNALIEERVKSIRNEIERNKSDIRSDEASTDSALEDLRGSLRTVNDQLKDVNSILENKVRITQAHDTEKKLLEKKSDIEKLLEESTADVYKAMDKHSAATRVMDQAIRDAEALKSDCVLQTIEKEILECRQNISKAESDIRKLENDRDLDIAAIHYRIQNRREKMTDLEMRPENCRDDSCPFIQGAVKASAELPSLENELAEKQTKWRSKIENTNKDIDRLTNAELRELIEKQSDRSSEVAALQRSAQGRIDLAVSAKTSAEEEKKHAIKIKDEFSTRLSSISQKLEGVKNDAAKFSEISIADARRGDLEAQRDKLVSEGTRIKTELKKRVSEKRDRISDAEKRIDAETARVDKAAQQRLESVVNQEKDFRSKLDAKIQEEASLKAKIGRIENNLENKAVLEKNFKTAQKEKARLITEISEWEYIRDACGKDGLRALEIDSVAPGISGYANDLLEMAFGNTSSVSLRTQDPNGKEILELVVTDEDGDEVLLSNRSGGESVWTLKALQLGMTLVSKEKSGRNFQTVFADEEDGALDSDNAQQFISLYRAFMEAGGFDTCFFISHRPECVAMADHVVRFSNGVQVN